MVSAAGPNPCGLESLREYRSMRIKSADLKGVWKEAIRGRTGKALAVDYLAPDGMAGVLMASKITLEPGASVGEHPHPETEELYLVLEGEGTGFLDDETFHVGPGDAWV